VISIRASKGIESILFLIYHIYLLSNYAVGISTATILYFPFCFFRTKSKVVFHTSIILKQFLFEDNPYLIFLTTLILIEVLYLIFSYKYIILLL